MSLPSLSIPSMMNLVGIRTLKLCGAVWSDVKATGCWWTRASWCSCFREKLSHQTLAISTTAALLLPGAFQILGRYSAEILRVLLARCAEHHISRCGSYVNAVTERKLQGPIPYSDDHLR